MGVGAGFGGVCFCPTVKACDLRGENALETRYNLASVQQQHDGYPKEHGSSSNR